jgi:hypothetical protein
MISESTLSSEKVVKLGIVRDDARYMYFIRDGDVWRAEKNADREDKIEQISEVGIITESGYVYYLDADGDISRKNREEGRSELADLGIDVEELLKMVNGRD